MTDGIARPRVAALGEAMIELVRRGDGTLAQSWGGDTLNTAIYLARLGIPVDYVTALGDDPESDAMVAAWGGEGVGTRHVLRVPDRLPGLYIIDVDARGERRFLYWRDRAPARDLFALPQTAALLAALGDYATVYLSGISLAIVGESGRRILFEALARLRAGGTRVAFDTNWRPRLWPDRATARVAYEAQFRLTDLAFLGADDMTDLFGDADEAAMLSRADAARVSETVLRRGASGCLVRTGDDTIESPAETGVRVVDTTAAGDAASAGYLAARLQGRDPHDASRAAHRLAAAVIGHPGAIIPRAAMRDPGATATATATTTETLPA